MEPSFYFTVPVPVTVPNFEKVMVPVRTFEMLRLRFRFRFQLHIYTIESKYVLKNLFPFYIVAILQEKRYINKIIEKCE